MYVELTPEDTIKDLRRLLESALPEFEFPRVNLYDYQILQTLKSAEEVTEQDFVLAETDQGVIVEDSYFSEELSLEEINILAIIMLDGWLQRQITSIENTRMKYSGSDFKFTSQANHLSKLITAKEKIYQMSHHLQRLYKRRRTSDKGKYESNWSISGVSALD